MKSILAVASFLILATSAVASDNYTCWQSQQLNGCGNDSIRSDSIESDNPAGKVSQTGGRTPNSSKG